MRNQCALLIVLCWSVAPSSNAHPLPLSIELSLPMKSVTVGEGFVSYTWFTPKPGALAMRQDLSGYTRHTARKALTPGGREWLLSWANRYRVFTFARRYPSTRPGL
jgi:hypothetical protein